MPCPHTLQSYTWSTEKCHNHSFKDRKRKERRVTHFFPPTLPIKQELKLKLLALQQTHDLPNQLPSPAIIRPWTRAISSTAAACVCISPSFCGWTWAHICITVHISSPTSKQSERVAAWVCESMYTVVKASLNVVDDETRRRCACVSGGVRVGEVSLALLDCCRAEQGLMGHIWELAFNSSHCGRPKETKKEKWERKGGVKKEWRGWHEPSKCGLRERYQKLE